jgi:NAD(P)H-hydrate repair Nnr-like enzyme with NAD(P)H-hydrate dehydratase domain
MYKSHFTILGLSNGEIYIWNEANPKLAVMGTGDLVCGIMAFFLSRKKNIPQSVLLTLSLLKKSLSIKELYPTVSSIRKYMKRKFT